MLEAIAKSIIFIILLALGGYFFVLFRRKGWFFPQKIGMKDSDFDRLHITGRLSMGGRHYIAVVQCNGQKFLVGISPSAVTSLGELMPSPPGKGSVSRKGEATCQNRGELLAKEVDSLAQKLVSQGSGYFQRH